MPIKIKLIPNGSIALDAEGGDFPVLRGEGQNDQLRDFQGPQITVHFNLSICSGAAECVHNLPSVFKSTGDDWIQPQEASVEEVIATVRKCPSGALTFTVDGKTEINQEGVVSVKIVQNGPYEIKGPVRQIRQCAVLRLFPRGTEVGRFEIEECCKRSKNMA